MILSSMGFLAKLWRHLVTTKKHTPLGEKIVEADALKTPNPFNHPSLPVELALDRVEIEFYCQMCHHYTYLSLNLRLDGNHIMVCPNCGHKHYRLVKNGLVTSDRFSEGACIADEILPMKSACVPESERRKRGSIAVLREMEAVGLLK